VRIYLSCPIEIARLYRIRIPDIRDRIQCVLVMRESFTKGYGSRVFHSSPYGPLFLHIEPNQLSLIPRTHCTGMYTVMRLPAPGEFWLNTVDLSFRVQTIAELMSEHLGATSGDPARPRWNRSITRFDPIALLRECNTRFQTVILTSVYTNGGKPPRRLGR